MLICAICGKHLRTQYLCSSVLSVGDSLCCLRFILPRIPQIFTDFIYSNIRVHLCYLWNTPSHPISVFICAICGRFLRTLTYVGDFLCCLRFDSPTDSTHRFYISQYPCSSVLSVGDFLCCLRFILPQISQIFTDFIYSTCYL